MFTDTLVDYVCPKCGASLASDTDQANEPDEWLVCQGGHRFRSDHGLVRFVENEGYVESFGFQWKTHRTSQLDSASNTSITRDRFFRGTRWPEKMEAERILEAGCGSGRFTEILLSTGAEVFSFDFSAAADVAFDRFAGQGAHVCQASIYDMPYPRASFDRVFCYGVIQHCPDVEKAFFSLVNMLRPGGHLAVDVYDRRKRLFNARYRVRWLTRRMDNQRLYRWCKSVVPLYMRVFPPLHPWNQLVVPIKDYRGALPGLTREQEIEWSVLDTFDALSPEYDSPQSRRMMERWCAKAGLSDIQVQYGGNGIEVRARKPE